MSGLPYRYPERAAVGVQIPKSRIYGHGQLGKALRERFVAQVERMVWAWKLAPETINLPERAGVQEIQIIELLQRSSELDIAVLQAIDKVIPRPIVFSLCYEDRVRTAAAYKRPSEADGSKWVLGEHYLGDWQPQEGERQPLPVALDLQALYEQMLRGLLPYPARPGEAIAAQLQRVDAIRRHERERARLSQQLQRERQFNRKLTLHAQLRSLNQLIETLSA